MVNAAAARFGKAASHGKLKLVRGQCGLSGHLVPWRALTVATR
jgi:hypothetical protein